MEDLFDEFVHQKVKYDTRTRWKENIRLGYPFHIIRDDVLEKGRADFTVGHENDRFGALSEEDKVLLYCFVFMPRHFYEALATFRAYKASLRVMFDSTRPTMMVDLGCGPGTAGLALCECLERPHFVYYGLDIAAAMRSKARSMLAAAKDHSLLGAKSQVGMTSSWAQLTKGAATIQKPTNVLFNATYLFSSDSLDVADVCNAVMAFKRSPQVRQLLFVYSNTTRSIAGEKFGDFTKRLKGEFIGDKLTECEQTYHKKRSSEPDKVQFVRQLLYFKDEQ